MKKLHISSNLAELEMIAESKGFKCAPKDHPIYSERQTIIFISTLPGKSADKAPQKPAEQPSTEAALINGR